MNLREIDRLVAEKVMGWKLRKYFEDDCYITDEWMTDIQDKFNNSFIVIDVDKFNPSTDIRDAWQVVEKLKIAVIPQAGDPPTDMKYLAEIDRQPFGDNYEAYAGTAELAICLVALKSVGVNIE
jgi:hypothetical protein